MSLRRGKVRRTTKETDISVSLDLDGLGRAEVRTGIAFLDHMLTAFAAHGLFDLKIEARGDLEVDDHHLVEDLGICLGQAFARALGDGSGIRRFASVFIPFDETLLQVALDISGRPYLAHNLTFSRESVGGLATEMVEEFLRAFSVHARVTLHVRLLAGGNTHHIVEALFKGLGRALYWAAAVDERLGGAIPSTKGTLDR